MAAQIGPSIRIKGEVTAREPLTIAGHVDGTVAVEGHPLTIVAGGKVTADLVAQIIVVGGTVNGRLSAGTQIVVRETANIEGDLSAPSVSLAAGATVHGHVQTAERRTVPLPLAS